MQAKTFTIILLWNGHRLLNLLCRQRTIKEEVQTVTKRFSLSYQVRDLVMITVNVNHDSGPPYNIITKCAHIPQVIWKLKCGPCDFFTMGLVAVTVLVLLLIG